VLLLELVQLVLAVLGLHYVIGVICYTAILRLERKKSIPREKHCCLCYGTYSLLLTLRVATFRQV